MFDVVKSNFHPLMMVVVAVAVKMMIMQLGAGLLIAHPPFPPSPLLPSGKLRASCACIGSIIHRRQRFDTGSLVDDAYVIGFCEIWFELPWLSISSHVSSLGSSRTSRMADQKTRHNMGDKNIMCSLSALGKTLGLIQVKRGNVSCLDRTLGSLFS